MNFQRDAFWRFEHKGWEKAAPQYEACWSSLTTKFIPYLLRAVQVERGTNLLDMACGPGYVAGMAQSLGAVPVGTDFCHEMVRRARLRNKGIEFHEGDAQQLDFEAGSFDAVVTSFGVPHLSEPGMAFAEAFRVLKSGGRFGFTVWAKPDINPGARIVEEAIEKHAQATPDIPEGPPYFAFCSNESCREILSDIGFAAGSVSFDTIQVEWQVPTSTFLFESERDGGVRSAAVLKHQTQETLAAIKTQMREAVAKYKNGNGYAIPMTAHVVAARADK